MRAMARSLDGARHSLIELKAVDAAYPLAGKLTLEPAQTPAEALDRRDGVYGAAVDAVLAERLGLTLGDSFKIGEATVALRATIEREPDAPLGEFPLGPHVTISRAAFAETNLVQPGAIVDYDYRLLLPPGDRRRGLGRDGAREIPRRRLAHPHRADGGAVAAAVFRPHRAVPEPRRGHRAAGRRDRHRQRGVGLCQRQDRDDRDAQMSRRARPG